KLGDACTIWAKCPVERALRELAHLPSLPSCPCFYPADLVYQDALYDPVHNKTF
ncbi:isoleucine-tRNA ligase, partial [Halocaridina rubra]